MSFISARTPQVSRAQAIGFGLAAMLSLPVIAWGASFTPGNLVVLRVGDGSGALSAIAAPLFLEEVTTAGAAAQTITIPTSGTGRVTQSGSSTSEGYLSLSSDHTRLAFVGYDANSGTAAVVTTAANRVIAVVNATGAVNTTTQLTDAYVLGNIRSGVTSDGTKLWSGGTSGTASNAGVRFAAPGASTSTQVSSTQTNTRVVRIFNGQLYVTSAAGAFFGISTVGSGLPTTSGQTMTILPGMPTTTGHSPYSFSINPSGNKLYVADDGAVGSGGGIQKWTLSAGTWSLAYTLLNNGSTTTSTRGLTVDWSGANPVIYATTTAATSTLIKVTDTGAGATATVIATAPALTAYRGVDFAPGSTVPVTLSRFEID